MEQISDYHLYPLYEPRQYPLTYLLSNDLYPLVISGLINPMGPTLTVIAAVKDKTSAPMALVFAYLNPFRSELFVSGYFLEKNSETYFPKHLVNVLSPFNIYRGGAPSFFIKSPFLEDIDEQYLCDRLLSNTNDLKRALGLYRKFPLNPWDRISFVMKQAYNLKIDNSELNLDSENMSEADMNELLQIIFSQEHVENDLRAFVYAWKGSIQNQRDNNNDAMADSAMQYDDFSDYLFTVLEASSFEYSNK